MSAKLFLDAVKSKPAARPAIGSGTSIVTEELMDITGQNFPQAHTDPFSMAALAIAGHTILNFDVVMPLYSVWHESAALGCPVNWGDKHHMPDCREAIYKIDDDITITKDFLRHNAVQTPLKALSILKKRLGGDCAVCGKVFGPWTLGYHLFGVEQWLINAMLQPDLIRKIIDRLKNVTIWFAQEQLQAGADCLLLADHATRDLCGPDMYRDFLLRTHTELARQIKCPLILHICGDTKDRIEYIKQTGLDCFHWDTKSGSAKQIRELAGDKLSLMGGVSNIESLYSGTREDVRRQVQDALSAGINIIGPECAVPLNANLENLKVISETVSHQS